jgi:hypothetical protein
MVTNPARATTLGQTALQVVAAWKSEPVHESAPAKHPALGGFWPSERRAILTYWAELRRTANPAVSLEEAVVYWEHGPAGSWRQAKMRLDSQKQVEEIERHKYHLSRECGYDIGWDRAANDWIGKYAARWREWWEEQPQSIPELPASCFAALPHFSDSSPRRDHPVLR